ncbi:glucosamine-6-phosphate deaminase [Nanchangia anserum]|uniref:Glucosamine-6-phosphate deaminase n=1 Tax=Nanchangia anserum TaxID=2692125 RepID=A0A8I0GBZ1_9ACTO|nr:glucosamine-6-phosphate deaminase [Nanchangia anserum]MBD3689365.1 glucosamine-6-phosphate deaminase [Nanchangia anserum]QOX81571.1 glucosamine-6-phosphate deaminase [Nanchangia anserum]
MRIGIFATADEVADQAAALIIRAHARPDFVLGVATGGTPIPLYERLRAAHSAGRFDLSHARAFALDEYIGIAADHPERYRNFLCHHLIEADEGTGLRESHLHTPDALAEDPYQAAADYDQAIRDSGGVDIQILGIGADGHIGFNEPGGSLTSRTNVGVLTARTRQDNARFFDDDLSQVPTQCVTQGLGTIMEARHLLLLATGAGKAEAVAHLVEGAVSARWPATITQMHPHTTVLVDEAAAARLELADFYRAQWEAEAASEQPLR